MIFGVWDRGSWDRPCLNQRTLDSLDPKMKMIIKQANNVITILLQTLYSKK